MRTGGGGLFWSSQLFENFIISNITQKCQKKEKKRQLTRPSSTFKGELSFPSKTHSHSVICSFIWLLRFVLLVHKLLEAGTGHLTEPLRRGAGLKHSTQCSYFFYKSCVPRKLCVNGISINPIQFEMYIKCYIREPCGECF